MEPARPSTTPTSRRSRPTSWPSSPPTTSPSTSRRCAGGHPSRPSATPGRPTRHRSRSIRTTSSRDRTPSARFSEAPTPFVLDLIARETGRANGAAVDWLREELGIRLDGERPRGEGRRRLTATYAYVDE